MPEKHWMALFWLATAASTVASNPVTETTSCKLDIPRYEQKQFLQINPSPLIRTVCGGVVTHSFGNVTSPNYPRHYDDLLYCKWIFQTEPNHRFIFQFYEHFSTELGYDRVTIYDGGSPDSPIIIEWSGNQSQGHIFATTENMATVKFTSDNSLNYPGFALYYSSEPKPPCGALLTNSTGMIETPDFPAHYPSSLQCRWVITAAVNHRIVVSFQSFQTEPGRDILTILDPITDIPLLIHSGYNLPEPIISPSNQLMIQFRSDYMINHPGFEIEYKIV